MSLERSIAKVAGLLALRSTHIGSERSFGFGCDPFLIAPLTLVENTAYWMYLGHILDRKVIKRIYFEVTTGGTGAQTAEVALASTPSAPNRANQVLTKIAHDASLAALTGTGLLSNGNDMDASVDPDTHLWAGIRTAMATNEPALYAVGSDYGQGRILTTAVAGALSGAGPWTGAVISHAVAAQCPVLHVTLD